MDRDERRAKFVYEAARLESEASDRPIKTESWEERDEDFRLRFIAAVAKQCGPFALTSPEALHDAWVDSYLEMGWVWGPKRDPVKKEHPDLIRYEDLPEKEQQKDKVFYLLCQVACFCIE